MTATAWRAVLLPLLAIAALFVVFGPAVQIQRDDFGVGSVQFASQELLQDVAPGSAAAAAGLKKGDRIRFLAKGLSEKIAVLFPVPSVHARVIVNGTREVTLVAGPAQPVSLSWNIGLTLVRLAFLLVAALLAWRRPDDRASRALVVFLFTLGFGIALNNNAFESPSLSFIVLQLLSTSAILYSFGAAAQFAALFPSGQAPRTSRIMSNWTVGVCLFGIGVFIFASLVQIDTVRLFAVSSVVYATFVIALGLLGATLIERYVHSPLSERRRRFLIFVILAAGLLGPAVDILVALFGGFNHAVDAYASLTLIVIPVGLAYVILRHRVIDVGFVLNRAAVYGVVSIFIVGVFVVVETLLAKYVESTSHLTSTAVQLAVALALGFSIRAIHGRADRFVDNVLFRARHQAEAAIRTFAHDAPYITDERVLGERCIETVVHHAGARGAGIWLRDASGAYRPVQSTFADPCAADENDAALVGMRARRVIVEPARIRSTLPGVLAFPMVVRGELIGTLVCGPKTVDESYAPDEIDALEALCTAVGHAYDALEVRQLRLRLQAMQGGVTRGAPV